MSIDLRMNKGILINLLCYTLGIFVGFFSSYLVNLHSPLNFQFSNQSRIEISPKSSLGPTHTIKDYVGFSKFMKFSENFEDQTNTTDTTTFKSKNITESKLNSTTTDTSTNNSSAEKVVFQIDQVLDGLSQNDQRILDFIRKNHVYKPQLDKEYNLTMDKEYNLTIEKDFNSYGHGQIAIIQRILKYMKNGIFVESGALDGERNSNTLPLEVFFGWSGLLIEPQPDEFQKILSKNRKSICLDVCLSPVSTPMKMQFIKPKNPKRNDITRRGSMDDLHGEKEKDLFNLVSYQCFPLWSILSVFNITTIDYFSFDIEGSELEVLQNFPFDKVYIKTITMEKFWRMEREAMKTFMFIRGFDFVQEIHFDYIFVHQNLNYHQHQLAGSFKNAVSGLCIDTGSNSLPFFLDISTCRDAVTKPIKNTFRVTFYLTRSGVLRYYEGGCWSVQNSGLIEVVHCFDTNFEQFDKWKYNSNKNLIHIKSGECVVPTAADGKLKTDNCTNDIEFKWDFIPKPLMHFN